MSRLPRRAAWAFRHGRLWPGSASASSIAAFAGGTPTFSGAQPETGSPFPCLSAPGGYADALWAVAGVQAALWAQYALDNAATVEEALAKLATVQIVKVEIGVHAQKQAGTVHVALEDASGDSAILEYLGGKLVVHQGREFRVMTNAPEYDKQLELLGSKDFANPTMETQVPGNVNPRDRFQPATYFLSVLTKPTSERAGVAGNVRSDPQRVDPFRRASQRLDVRYGISNSQQSHGQADWPPREARARRAEQSLPPVSSPRLAHQRR